MEMNKNLAKILMKTWLFVKKAMQNENKSQKQNKKTYGL